jgi:sec-independent protein translocase protein TatA
MHTIMAAMIGGTEIMVIAIAALVLFGARKIPEFAKGLGQAVKEFKKASNDDPSEVPKNPPSAPPATQ